MCGSYTFVPTRWMCKKQTSVSHSSTESEIIFLDAGLRMDGIPALDLWDFVMDVLHSSFHQPKKSKENVQGNLLHDTPLRKHTKNQVKTPTQHNDLELCNVDYVSSNVKSSQFGVMLYIFEDNEAVIKMTILDRSPTMRHVHRTHRVAIGGLFDSINLDPRIRMKYVDTKNQLADILTKGNFTRDEWNNHLHLFNISIFSSTSCSEAMSKRMQQGTGGENGDKVEADVDSGLAYCGKLSNSAEFECIKSSGATQGTQCRDSRLKTQK